MLKSIQEAAAGLRAQILRNDVIANNLANAATDGFRRQIARFQRGSGSGGPTAAPTPGDLAVTTLTDFRPGDFSPTGKPLDLVIAGDGFFVVEDDGGERFTRTGSFRLNDQGEMVTASGLRLQGASGPIVVDITLGSPEVAPDGSVSVGDDVIGQVRVVRFDDPAALNRVGDNLFASAPGAARDLEPTEVRLRPGFVEGSNVNAVTEMVSMLSALRTYQANEKSIRAADELLDTMINRIGRVPTSGG